MKSYEFSRYYNPRIGRFVYRHKGTGLIVDNIFKPMRKVAAKGCIRCFQQIRKARCEKSIAIRNLSRWRQNSAKKAAEKSGDLIMKKLGNMRIGSKKQPVKNLTPAPAAAPAAAPAPGESSEEILNRLISGQGVKRNKRI